MANEPTKWEYALIVVDYNSPDGTKNNLKVAGDAGWEVVASYIGGDGVPRFVAKRPKE